MKTRFENDLWSDYGISLHVFNVFMEKQDYKCPISGNDLRESKNIDHCHTTDYFRAILWPGVNRALGQVKDKRETLHGLYRYLKNDGRFIPFQRIYKKNCLTVQEKQQILNLQNNRCLGCGELFCENNIQQLDHNWKTGYIRGYLCHGCNSALGFINDNLKYIINMCRYLRNWKSAVPFLFRINPKISRKGPYATGKKSKKQREKDIQKYIDSYK